MRTAYAGTTMGGMADPRPAYLARLDAALVGPARTRRSLVREAADHLDDATAALVAAGWTEDDAARRAVEEFGPVAEVAAAFQTTLAVLGGICCAVPYGSALSGSTWPAGEINRYLYSSPRPTPGTNPHQKPVFAINDSGVPFVFQPLKSPTTLTACAFGAHTANCVPRAPSRVVRCAPSFS